MRAHMRALVLLIPAVAGLEMNKYLIISAPKLHKVVYTQIGGLDVDGAKGSIHPLVEEGLLFPQGIAVDNNRGRFSRLYVADPEAKKIISYQLAIQNGRLLAADKPQIAAMNVEARWVAVDSAGGVYYSDEANSMIMRVDLDKNIRGIPVPYAIYDALDTHHVSAPGGVAVDNYNIFWTNKALGTVVGSVVRGVEQPPEGDMGSTSSAIAKNLMKVYGVCLSQRNVYYTNQDKAIYGVKKHGGAIAVVSEDLQQPRGCAWDGDGTMYVADKGSNAVYEFPGNMRQITHMPLTKVVDMEDAFGVAVMSGCPRAFLHAAAWGTAMGVALAALGDIAFW